MIRNERKAWLLLAELFSGKADRFGGVQFSNFGAERFDCICMAVGRALYISKSLCERMQCKVRAAVKAGPTLELGRDRLVYLYPLSRAGAKKRAAFCRRMADEVKPSRRKHAKTLHRAGSLVVRC